jgi:hypothetical protein
MPHVIFASSWQLNLSTHFDRHTRKHHPNITSTPYPTNLSSVRTKPLNITVDRNQTCPLEHATSPSFISHWKSTVRFLRSNGLRVGWNVQCPSPLSFPVREQLQYHPPELGFLFQPRFSVEPMPVRHAFLFLVLYSLESLLNKRLSDSI